MCSLETVSVMKKRSEFNLTAQEKLTQTDIELVCVCVCTSSR